MTRILLKSRYLIILPIIGLALAAAAFFIYGGIGLMKLLYNVTLIWFGLVAKPAEVGQGVIIFEVVEYVHTFLIGTVLYITAMGFYQLFIRELDFPAWLKIDSTDELETKLIGVTVVVLAVNFMGAIFVGGTNDLLQYGAGVALPIAALGIFVGLRAWSTKISREIDMAKESQKSDAPEDSKNIEQI